MAHTPVVLGDQLSCDKVGQPEGEREQRYTVDKMVTR